MNTLMHRLLHTHMHARRCMHTLMHTQTRARTLTHLRACTRTHTHAGADLHAHAHVHIIRMPTPTYTHRNTAPAASWQEPSSKTCTAHTCIRTTHVDVDARANTGASICSLTQTRTCNPQRVYEPTHAHTHTAGGPRRGWRRRQLGPRGRNGREQGTARPSRRCACASTCA